MSSSAGLVPLRVPAAVDRQIAQIIDDAAPIEEPQKEVVPIEATSPPDRRKRKRRPSRSAEETGPGQPRDLGFDIDRLNEVFALVLMGSKAVVFFEQPYAMLEDQKRMLTVEAFNAWFANRFTEVVGRDGRVSRVTWAKRWLQSPSRRSYVGIEFHPDPQNAAGTKDYLNLWSGFAVEPAIHPDPRRYAVFRDHLLNNVCGGADDLFAWVFAFFAHVVQRPRERIGTALVLRGKMGSGKTIVGETIGSLFPRHYFLVDDPRYVTGQFNAHMATCLLLQADEAVWAGDKAAEGRLKGLVTAPIQQIEAKGIDPIRLPNYVRLIMTSNEGWVVPAGMDERRFCVLDVDQRCAQNHDYFAEMQDELAGGGLSHLLADLLAFDLESVNLRQIPRTMALLEQKIRSLGSIESWWLERLTSGISTRQYTAWVRAVPCQALFDDYVHIAERVGVKRKQEQIVFGIALGKLAPTTVRTKRTIDGEGGRGRVWCYLLPELDEAREQFEELMGQPMIWPVDTAPEMVPEGDTEYLP